VHYDKKIQDLTEQYGNWVKQPGEGKCKAAKMSQDLYPYSELFSPITINHMTVKNRLVMAPMGNINMCEETGRPNDKMIQYFLARAKGGTGLITSGLIPISFGVDNSLIELGNLTYFPRIDRSRTVFSGWRDLAHGIHNYGGKFFIQLTPGLGRVGNPQCLVTQRKFPVSASLNPNFYMPMVPCLPLTDLKLKKIIKNAGQAGADAMAADIDGVYLHGHEGYLLEQLTNPAFNRRKFGRYADWQAFGIDMVKEIRKRCGDRYPIMYRIDLSLALNETYGDRMDTEKSLKKFKNGRSIEMTLEYMENLVKAGVDLFDVDLGCYDNWWLPHPPASMPAGCFLDVSRIVKQHFADKQILSNAGVAVPVVAVGKLGYPDLAEQALRDGDCDMVMLGRPLLADPDWCNKAYAGKVADIIPCIGCQEGCLNEFVEGGHPQCAVNPRTAFEHLYPEVPTATKEPKRIAVVGAGPAGSVLAMTAAQRGHKVDLLEKSGVIGGKIIPGSIPKIKFDFDNYRQWLDRQVRTAAEKGELTLKTDFTVTTDWLKTQNYDAVIFALGTKASVPPIPGLATAPVVEATDLLVNPEKVGAAKRAIVVGGGVVGCETAYWLAYEKGLAVDVIEMLPNFMEGACTANRGHLIYYLEKAGVRLFNCARVTGFEGGKVSYRRNVSKNRPNPYVTWTPLLPKNIEVPFSPELGPEEADGTLETDIIVLAAGGRPDDAMYFEAQRENAAPLIYNIGDSFAGKRVLEAVQAAYALGTKL